MEARAHIAFLMAIVITTMLQDAFSADITTEPESVTVFLNDGGRANFTCQGTGGALKWTVEGKSPDNSLNQGRDITVTNTSASPGVLSSVLSIAVLPNNDKVTIICLILSSNLFELTTSATTLTIRGISPVEDIQWSNDNQSLSWSPPSFYSKDIPLGTDPTYNVLVNDISYINTTDTSVLLNTTGLNIMCTNVTVSITASIEQYVSQDKEDSFNITANHTIDYENVTRNFDELSQKFVVNLNGWIRSSQSCKYTIVGRVDPDDEGIQENTQTAESDDKEEIFLYKMTGLRPCTNYTAYIEINENDALGSYLITTSSNVQDLLVSTEGNGLITVKCMYAEPSTANGCHVSFTHTVTGKKDSFNITGSGSILLFLLTSGEYIVSAHDISNDGSIVPWTCIQPKKVYVNITPTHSISSGTNSIAILMSQLPSPTDIIQETDGSSSPGSKADDDLIYGAISGVIGALVVIVAILAVVPALLFLCKRESKKKRLDLNSEIAACHQPQAEMSHYEIHDPNGPVAIDMSNDERPSAPTSGPVQGNIEHPYHVSTDELIAIRNGRSVQHNNSHVTTTSPQEGQTQNSSSPSSHEPLGSPPSVATPSHDHDDNPTVTVGSNTAVYSVVGRRTDTDLVINTPPAEYTGDISKGQPTYSLSSTCNSTAPLLPPGHEDDNNTTNAYTTTPATATANYAVVAKGTDATVPPAAVAQPSEYGEITGHINKRGIVTTYTPPVPPKATQPTIDIDIHDDEDDRHMPTNNTKVPPPAYDDVVVPTECSHPQEEISVSTSGLSTSVYSPPSGPTGNYPIIHNTCNIHLHFGAEGVEVKYDATSSSTSDYNSRPEVVVEPVQLPNKGPVDVEEEDDDDRCIVTIVGTFSTSPPPFPCSACFSNTGTPTTGTSISKDHVSAGLPIYLGKGELFNGIQQQHDDYNHQRSILVVTRKYRPHESSVAEDDNIEATPIVVGDECETKKVKKEGEVSSSDIEMFSGGRKVKIFLQIDSRVNVPFVGSPGAGKTTLSLTINDTATGPFGAGLFVDEHKEEKERVSDIDFKRRKKSNEIDQKNVAVTINGELGKTKPKEILCQKKAIDRPKKVFNRHKGSTKSATGFSSQRQTNYNLLSKMCESVRQFLYLKLSLLICIVNCIPFSDLNDALLVYDRSTIQSTVVGASVWFESLNYKHRVRKKDKEQASIGKNHGTLYMLSLLFVYLVLIGIYNQLSSLKVPIFMITNGLFNVLSLFNLYISFNIYATIIISLILSNFASTYFDLIQKLSSTTTATYLEPVDEIPHDPDPP